ncbi:MAG: 30S ribosomal protein S24e [Thermoprotei archaeon]|nr:30S ribosomal protein S24e [Thermoprotei archaeon]
MEVESDRYNPLIGRREIVLKVNHLLKSTPSRRDLRARLAEVYRVDASRVYVRSIFTRYGSGESRVRVHVYDGVERALAFEPKYIIERNGGVEFKV